MFWIPGSENILNSQIPRFQTTRSLYDLRIKTNNMTITKQIQRNPATTFILPMSPISSDGHTLNSVVIRAAFKTTLARHLRPLISCQVLNHRHQSILRPGLIRSFWHYREP